MRERETGTLEQARAPDLDTLEHFVDALADDQAGPRDESDSGVGPCIDGLDQVAVQGDFLLVEAGDADHCTRNSLNRTSCTWAGAGSVPAEGSARQHDAGESAEGLCTR